MNLDLGPAFTRAQSPGIIVALHGAEGE